MRTSPPAMDEDPFLRRYQPSELKIASEFLTTWLPFLSRDLCRGCKQILSDRIRSLDQVPAVDGNGKPANVEADAASSTQNNMDSGETGIDGDYDFDGRSTGSLEDGGNCDTHSLGSWKDGRNNLSESVSRNVLLSESPITEIESPRMSWADMAQEDQLGDEEELREKESDRRVIHVSSTGDLRVTKTVEKPKLSREQREYFRLMNVKRKKDFICLERFKGKIVNILEGLELHTGVFSAVEQKRIVDFVYEQQEKGRRQELKERTYSAPNKWMRGKGRVTLQFGCCYNYATDKDGNPPGILQHETVDPIPHLFKVIIRRLVRWHVLPPACVPDSCIVNIYEEGDCIPPHIDNHDFLRPFCTVSFLSECSILFGSNLKIVGPGEFSGSYAISLPMGSVLVLKGNGADVAKHCVPAVPAKRISITFRKMDESKRPVGFIPEPDLQGIQPLPYETNETSSSNSSGFNHNGDRGILPLPYETNRTSSTNLSGFSHNGNRRQPRQREGKAEVRDCYPERSNSRYEPRGSSGQRRVPGPQNRRRTKVDLDP